MLKSELSYFTTSSKQLGVNSRSNSPWRVLLNFHCQVGATRKMVHRIRATAHFHIPTPKILTDVADTPKPQNHPQRRRVHLLWQGLVWSGKNTHFHHTKLGCSGGLRDGTATAPFLHRPKFSIKYTQFTVKSGLQTLTQFLWFKHYSRTRNLFQIFQGTEFEPVFCHN